MDLNKLNLFDTNNINKSEIRSDQNAIAIIGINAQIGMAKTKEEFWQNLCNANDFICEFPEQRLQDAKEIYEAVMGRTMKTEPFEAAYMERIDLFDASFFQIAPTEAEYMDPNQRLFLEAAWSTIQDAGYDPIKLKGSSMGVYLGYTSDENQYIGPRDDIDEFTYGVAVSGNVNSIIASRISYLLDLKGPAMAIDTACSSSLVALHVACQQILSGEVAMALVGGIRLVIAPLQDSSKTLGIESTSRRTKTFDESADGTGGGEGVICVMLKHLEDAIADQDNIYAVVKGSAINQDGASMGITAPNADSQAEVLRTAWERAKIDPETISYIEAHGTATELGDPVEIDGIEQAFREYTDKKQFCAIGSVKSNVGHLDCAAGLAGLVKAVMMLKHKVLLPTIHFQSPNRNIDFVESPVYVNDKLRIWECNGVRRCGVSSFGISGTNCHVVLEEAPMQREPDRKSYEKEYLITISAKTNESLRESVEAYCDYLSVNAEVSFDDFCYTLNVGRGDYSCRLSFVCKNREVFLEVANDFVLNRKNKYYYGEHRVVDQVKLSSYDLYITAEAKQIFTEQIRESLQTYKNQSGQYATLDKIARLYVQGGEVDWENFYPKLGKRVSIPSYPFKRKRYWIKSNLKEKKVLSRKLHPYLDKCVVDTHNLRVYEKKISVENCWELRDHKINDVNVLPGTAFIEIAQYVGDSYYPNEVFEINDLIYLTPLSGSKERTLHVIVQEKNSYLEVACYSKGSDDWEKHVEFTIHRGGKRKRTRVVIDEVKERCQVQDVVQRSQPSMVKIEGEGWNNVQDIFSGNREILISFQLDQKLTKIKEEYLLFPAMLDPAINGGSYLVGDEYLPFSFDKARFYRKMPNTFYSYIEIKETDTSQFICFDIYLCTEDGEVFAELNNYRIKRIDNPSSFLSAEFEQGIYHKTEWILDSQEKQLQLDEKRFRNVLVVSYHEDVNNEFLQKLKLKNACEIQIVNSVKEIENLQQEHLENFDMILYVASRKTDMLLDCHNIQENVEFELGRAYKLIRRMIQCQVRRKIDIVFLTKNAMKVTGAEKVINPIERALIGFATCINLEHGNFNTRVIDWDDTTTIETVIEEISHAEEYFTVAMRDNDKYIERMVPISPITTKANVWLKERGVYVITGGLGGMGLAFANYMFQIEPSIKIIIFNRSYSLDDLINNHDMFSLNSEKLKKIHDFLELGYDVDVKKVDVSNYDEVECAIKDIHQCHGRINGIIHAAGVKGEGFIINRTWEEFEQVLRPKIYGTCMLDVLTKEDYLDFFVMCSSITSLFGEPGQSQYTAANAFLDSYCNYYNGQTDNKMITIDWTGWNQSGMAVDNRVIEDNVYVKFLTDSEGAVAFEKTIVSGNERVIVGAFKQEVISLDYMRYNRFIKLEFGEKESNKDMNDSEISTFQSLTITGKSLSEISEIERNVICAWANTLGVTEIDVNDKFFESGGNSLLASYLHKEISNFYPGVLVITDVFMYSTIEEIANFIDKKLNKTAKEFETIEEDVDELVQKFMDGELSRESFEALL